jgi:thioredoxin 1
MRMRCLTWAMLLSLMLAASGFAQSTSTPADTKKISDGASSAAFPPLDQWKAAVLAGDKSALAGFYSAAPPARSVTPQGKSEDPTEEPIFWSAVTARGVSNFETKLLEVRRPRPGVVILIMRIEMAVRTGSSAEPGFVSTAQGWSRQGDDWRIYFTKRSDLLRSSPSRLREPEKPNTDLYPPPEEAEAEIASALVAAARDHKRVILVFGGNWCFDCHVLDEAFHSKAIAPTVEQNYEVVHVNIGEGKQNLDLAKKYEVPLDKGVPSLAVLDPDGKVVYSQKQGEFESTARIGPEDVLQFLEKWKPTQAN